ncbi:MAG: YlbE-like family protein [Bacilli bacterium]
MTTDVQIKISSDPRLVSFIRQYPIWYKRLNRNPLLFREFNEDMKDKFKIRPSDKLNKTLENISMIQAFLDVLK